MNDKEIWERPAIADIYDWILFNVRQAYGLENNRQAAIWMSANGNSKGYSPYFLDYCTHIATSDEDLEGVIEF